MYSFTVLAWLLDLLINIKNDVKSNIVVKKAYEKRKDWLDASFIRSTEQLKFHEQRNPQDLHTD